jgi:hypothetical protein
VRGHVPLRMRLLAGMLVTVGTGCALVRAVDKAGKITGLEEAQVVQSLEKHQGRSRPDGTMSRLQANPSPVAFGDVVVGFESRQAVVISNPSNFTVTILSAAVQGSGFAILSPPGDRSVIPAHGELALTLTFHPVVQGACSGQLLLEIDSAVRRFTHVALTGAGV